MTGVYCITNDINGYRYVGASVDIHTRWVTHLRNYKNETCKEYGKLLYQAMRHDGVEHFHINVIEECSPNVIHDREKYWIQYYDTMSTGYNETPGGIGVKVANDNDKHPNHKLSLDDIIAIRTAYQNHERKQVVFQRYKCKINKTGFHKIWNGFTWPHIMPEVYTKENIDFHTHNTSNAGSANGRAKLTEDDVRTIRTRRKNGETCQAVYQDYKDKTTRGSFKNVWCYQNWKNIIV